MAATAQTSPDAPPKTGGGERPSLRSYARHILRFGSRRQELGILLLSAVNIAVLLGLFGTLTTIASKLAVGAEGGPRGFMPEIMTQWSLSALMGLSLGLLLASFAVSLLLRMWVTAEAYRMLERATVAAFDATKRELAVSDRHLRRYPTVLKSAVRFMSVAYLQVIALLFPVTLVVVIVGFGLVVEPVLTGAIAGTALMTIPVFLFQSRHAQRNSERLARTLSDRSAHIGRSVTNLFHHPSERVADGLSIRSYLDSAPGAEFRDAYVHRQRVGAYSSAVSTVGTILGIVVVFGVLLFGGDDWFSLPNLVLAVLLFRVLENNIGSVMKLLGNLRATVPFTTLAVELFERDAAGFPDAQPLVVTDRAEGLGPWSPLGTVVLSDLPWTRPGALRIARAVETARKGRVARRIIALTGDFDLVAGEAAEEIGALDAAPDTLSGFETLERAARFLELAPEDRTQDEWRRLSRKGRFVLTALAARERLEGNTAVLALNASDITLISAEERELLPWIFDRRDTVLIFESIPPASRLPESLDLLAFDGRRLERHGTLADFDDVVDGIYEDLVLGLRRADVPTVMADVEGDLIDEALEGADFDLDDSVDGESESLSEEGGQVARRVGYARELETTVWYERWVMARGDRTPIDGGPEMDLPEGNVPDGPSGDDPLAPHRSAFGLTRAGRDLSARLKAEAEAKRDAARRAQSESIATTARELREARKALRLIEREVDALTQRADAADARVAELQAKRAALQGEISMLRRELVGTERRDEAELSRARVRLEAAEASEVVLRERIEAGTAALTAVRRDLAAAQTKAKRDGKRARASSETARASIAELREKLRAADAETRELRNELLATQRLSERDIARLTGQSETLRERLLEREAELREARNTLGLTERERDRAVSQLDHAAKRAGTSPVAVTDDALAEDIAKMGVANARLRDELAAARRALAEAGRTKTRKATGSRKTTRKKTASRKTSSKKT